MSRLISGRHYNRNKSHAIALSFTYVGQYGVFQESDNLYYMRARYYDATVGRFISEDPTGFDGGDVNLYAYVAGNPIMLIDPLGLCNNSAWWDPKNYISTSLSYSLLGQGKQINTDKTEQTVYSLSLIGASYDVQMGILPSSNDVQCEFSIGLGEHLGIRIYFAAPVQGGPIDKLGISFHFGLGVGSPLNLSATLTPDATPRLF